jgi:hypothetical protein
MLDSAKREYDTIQKFPRDSLAGSVGPQGRGGQAHPWGSPSLTSFFDKILIHVIVKSLKKFYNPFVRDFDRYTLS